MDHECTQADNIHRVMGWLDGTDSKPGLREDVVVIKTHLSSIDADLRKLATSVSALVKFQVEMKTIYEMRNKKIMNAWQKTAVIIAGIGGLSTIIIKIFDVLKT